VSCVGRGAITTQIELVKWADETPSVKRFLPSEYGTDIEYGPDSAHEKPHQGKIKVRAAIRQTKTLDYAFLVTGPYPDMWLTPTLMCPEIGSWNVKEKKAVLIGDGNGKISFTAMSE